MDRATGRGRFTLRQYSRKTGATLQPYRDGMDMLPSDLQAAALQARDRLAGYAARTAQRGIGPGTGAQAAMAGAARTAIFADALLGAMRARFEELRTAAK